MDSKLNSISDGVRPREAAWPIARNVALTIIGTLLLTVSAKLQVPFYPVPMTLQTFTVLALGAVLGGRLATASVALYLLEGLCGLPVFAGMSAGPIYMAGPTGGFLLGFLGAAVLVGSFVRRPFGRSFWGLVLAMSLGHIAIFVTGWAWLSTIVGPSKAWTLGVAPFYLATVLKTALSVAVVFGLDRLVGTEARKS